MSDPFLKSYFCQQEHTYETINISDFLRICTGRHQNGQPRNFNASLKKIEAWKVQESRRYKMALDQYRLVMFSKERKMYDLFTTMGNLFLEHAEKLAEYKSAKHIRLHDLGLARLEGTHNRMEPDVVLIPRTTRSRVTTSVIDKTHTRKRIDVREVLVSFELRTILRPESGQEYPRKRAREDSDEEHTVAKKVNCEAIDDPVANRRCASLNLKIRVPRLLSSTVNRPKPLVTIDNAIPVKLQIPPEQDLEMEPDEWVASKRIGCKYSDADIQLATYATEQMSARGDRCYTFGVKVKGPDVTLFFYHRSAVFVSKPFDFLCHPEYLAFFLLLFTRDPSACGFDKHMGYCDPFDLDNRATRKINVKWQPIQDESERVVSPELVQRMELKEKIDRRHGIIGRGTSVFKAELSSAASTSKKNKAARGAMSIGSTDVVGPNILRRSARLRSKNDANGKANPTVLLHPCGVEENSSGVQVSDGTADKNNTDPVVPETQASTERKGYVFKFSWQVTTRPAEVNFLLKARKYLPNNIPKVYGYAVVKDTTPARKFIKHCQTVLNKDCTSYEQREMRVLVMDYFEGLDAIKDDDFLVQYLMYQCMDCLHILYKEIKLLHGDISYGNLAFYQKGNEYFIVLLDFDNAKFADSEGATSKQLIGTIPFVSREFLYAANEPSFVFRHDIKHDLESVFNLMVWHGAGYRSLKTPTSDPLKSWREGSLEKILNAKAIFFTDSSYAKGISKCMADIIVWRNINLIRRAYQEEVFAANSVRSRALKVIHERVHVLAREAMDTFLRENPSFDENGLQAKKVYNAKIRKEWPLSKETSDGEIQVSYYPGISYKQIMDASDWPIRKEHEGCSCC